MRPIIIGFNDEFFPVVNELISKLCIDCVVNVNENSVEYPPHVMGISLNWLDVKYCRYSSLDYNRLMPLDQSIMEAMAPYEATAIKMVERIEPYIGRRTYDQRRSIYYRHLRVWNHIISEYQIDQLISFNVPHIGFDYVVYALCKIRSIPTMMYYRFPTIPGKAVNRYLLTDISNNGVEIYNEFVRLMEVGLVPAVDDLKSYSKAYIDEYVLGKKNDAFIDATNSQQIRVISTGAKIPNRGFFLKARDYLYRKINTVGRYKAIISNAVYESMAEDADYQKKYLYFPLHYQPEATTLPMAGPFVDQYLIAEMIAYYLPEQVYLYIKEHPRKDQIRSKDYYKRLKGLKNVRLIKKSEKSHDLISGSAAVVTATGTAGWEAVFRGIPVLMFGNYFYQYAPGVYRIRECPELQEALESIVEGKAVVDRKKLMIFLKAMEAHTVEGYLLPRYKDGCNLSEEENNENTVSGILRLLGKK